MQVNITARLFGDTTPFKVSIVGTSKFHYDKFKPHGSSLGLLFREKVTPPETFTITMDVHRETNRRAIIKLSEITGGIHYETMDLHIRIFCLGPTDRHIECTVRLHDSSKIVTLNRPNPDLKAVEPTPDLGIGVD